MDQHWIKNAIIYHIYPRSFQDTNHDGIGDLQGIIHHLDYLKGTSDSLDVDAIWLSPIYPSPMADFGYDVSDYKNIDPLFGTLEDFDQLITEAHQRGLKVLMDYIPNHTSSEHPWFGESRTSLDNDKRDWYIWRPGRAEGEPPNNWVSVFGGSAWEYDERTNQYYLHSFDKHQPDLNWRNPAVVAEMKSVLRFWLDRGVDGFRIDAYDFLFKDDRFLDEPPNPIYVFGQHGPHDSLIHTYSFGQPETLDMLRQLAAILEEYGQKFMVTEVYANIDDLVGMYSQVEKPWFAPFNFGLILSPWRADVHRQYIDEFDLKVGPDYLPTYVLGNHDQPRVAYRIGRDQAKVAAMLQFTLRGIPFVYYGEEIGMTNGTILPEQVIDPFEINSPGLGLGRDPQRTPMQWNAGPYAGFSETEPWLPVASDAAEWNVETERGKGTSFLELYRQLLHLRHTFPILTNGKYRSLTESTDQVFIYERYAESDRLVVILNYSNEDQVLSLPFTEAAVCVDTLKQLDGQTLTDFAHFHLLPNQGIILYDIKN